MPVTKSAKKSLRQDNRRRERNIKTRNQMKSLIKKAQDLVSQRKEKEAKELLPKIYKALDKAAKKGIIKKNTAARKKSRMTRLVSKKEEKKKED